MGKHTVVVRVWLLLINQIVCTKDEARRHLQSGGSRERNIEFYTKEINDAVETRIASAVRGYFNASSPSVIGPQGHCMELSSGDAVGRQSVLAGIEGMPAIK
eukprot:GHVT01082622.1.p1 GENE.GHVT01082622.1~~GHVT01082622.1.p1  ORF type:complete len:102 (-),score=6.25 GHVT01082622.1:322-627(-)